METNTIVRTSVQYLNNNLYIKKLIYRLHFQIKLISTDNFISIMKLICQFNIFILVFNFIENSNKDLLQFVLDEKGFLKANNKYLIKRFCAIIK